MIGTKRLTRTTALTAAVLTTAAALTASVTALHHANAQRDTSHHLAQGVDFSSLPVVGGLIGGVGRATGEVADAVEDEST